MAFNPDKPWEGASTESPPVNKGFDPSKPWKAAQPKQEGPGAGVRFVGSAKDEASDLGGEIKETGKDTWDAWTKGRSFGDAFQNLLGPIEGIGAGVAQMGAATAGGLTGTANAIKEGLRGNAPGEAFTKGKEAAEELISKHVDLEPGTDTGKAFLRAIGIIPKAITSAGNVAYETTQSPAIGAGVQTLAAYLSFGDAARPSLKGKKPTKVAEAASDAFETLAEEHPEVAREVVKKVPDEKLKQSLTEKLDDITISKSKQVKDIFKDAKSRGKGALAVTKGDIEGIFKDVKQKAFLGDLQEARGQEILDYLEERNISPHAVANKFWNDTYYRLQPSVQDKFLSMLKKTFGRGPKDVINNPQVGLELDLPNKVSGLEGTERGFVALMQEAISRTPSVTPQEASSSVRRSVATMSQEPVTPKDFNTFEGFEKAVDLRPAVRLADGRTVLGEKQQPHLLIAAKLSEAEAKGGKTGWQGKDGKFYTTKEIQDNLRVGEDPVVYMNMGIPVTKAALTRAFTIGHEVASKSQTYLAMEKEVRNSVDSLVRAVAPEVLGKDAQSAAAVLASNMAKQKHAESIRYLRSEPRRQFWNARAGEARQFLLKAERGEKFADDLMNKAAQGYKAWAEDIYKADQAKGIIYEPVDNYFFHITDDPTKATAFLAKRYGPQWGDPKFMKERNARYIDELEKAGFKLKTYNPEELFQLRQHASDIAHMKIDALRQMEEFGLARRIKKGDSVEPDKFTWRSPNGEIFELGDEPNQIFHNAFNTKSLWTMPNAAGTAFRATMLAKNKIVPLKLFSLFHPVHVATMTSADALTSATKLLASGKMSTGKYALEVVGQAFFKDMKEASFGKGKRSVEIWRGKVAEKDLTVAERQALQYQLEGGFIPNLSPELQGHSIKSFQDAVARHSVTAVYKAPFALLEKVFSKPIFEEWIPRLKTFAYDTAAARAIEANPGLLSNPLARMEALRKLQKSVDNRFGEMTYSTTFMNKMVKDTGVASMLSMGWQMGFLREYGGAIGEVGKALSEGGKLGERITQGQLDKAMFVGAYTAQALMLGGLMTYVLSGKAPSSLLDYVYPKNGDKNPDGSEARLSTPYYTREFASIAAHTRNEGLVHGLSITVQNKVSPAIGTIRAWATNLDSLNREISDPNGTFLNQLGQKLKYTLGDMEPAMVASTVGRGKSTTKDIALAGAGFSPAPKYAGDSTAEGAIKSIYNKYYRAAATPYEKAEYSQEASKLRQALSSGDNEAYNDSREALQEKHGLSSKQLSTLERSAGTKPEIKMFSRMTVQQQIQVLGKMSAEELEEFLPHAKKELRYTYEQ